MQAIGEDLLSYGTVGAYRRFRPLQPLVCTRGDRAVVRSHRGLELATVLCETAPGHALFLPNTTVGQLVRVANTEDEILAQQVLQRARLLFPHAPELANNHALPLE